MSYQTIYPDIPRIDAHTHVGRRPVETVWADLKAVRDKAKADSGITIALQIDLDGGVQRQWVQDPVAGIAKLKQHPGIIGCLSDSKPAQGLKASSPDDAQRWLDAGYCGWKWHWNAEFNGGSKAKYGLINDPYFRPYFDALEAAGMPLMCLHLEAPWGDIKAQQAALRSVMDRHPDLIVVQAHFGAQRWGSLADHAKVFDAHPNFYRDISTTAQHLSLFAGPDESREFFIKYSDRLLYGTDNICSHRADEAVPVRGWALKYERQAQWLETAGPVPSQGIGKLGPRTPEHIPGLNLPRAALEAIYWRNAVRIIPHVREAMIALGYSLPTGEVPKPGTPTPRAQRLIEFLPRLKPADIDTLSQEQRAGVSSQLARLGLGGSK
jgi:predicted TIM-barrel fold metal-dependent hydrolase